MMLNNYNCYVEQQDVAYAAPRAEVSFDVLEQLYGNEAAKALMFLVDRAGEAARSEFIMRFVDIEQLVRLSTANIVVRCTEKSVRRTGNTGLFQIFVQMSNGEARLLHFTNQVSTVYYLMYLIDRRHKQDKQGMLPPLNLGGNKQAFVELYHRAYDNITHDEILRRYNLLLYRQEGKTVRAGRLNEVIYDIRRNLNKLFGTYGQNYLPYAMTARSHLAIPAKHILFEGEAEQLLQLHCA